MDIRTPTDEERKEVLDNLTQFFEKISKDINSLREDIYSTDLEVQATSVWISGQLCRWYHDFLLELHKREEQFLKVKQEMGEIENDNNIH